MEIFNFVNNFGELTPPPLLQPTVSMLSSSGTHTELQSCRVTEASQPTVELSDSELGDLDLFFGGSESSLDSQ